MLLIIYLLSIPFAFGTVMVGRIEERNTFTDHDGGWWSSMLHAMRWNDLLISLVIGLIPVLNSVCTVVFIVAGICFLVSDWVGDALSKPVFSRKVVINMKKDESHD